MSEVRTDPFNEGRWARREGYKRSANPYPFMSDHRSKWDHGWAVADTAVREVELPHTLVVHERRPKPDA